MLDPFEHKPLGSRLLSAVTGALLVLAAATWWRKTGYGGLVGSSSSSFMPPSSWISAGKDTLVLYIYRPNDDSEYANNFNYFVLAAMMEEYRCEYVVLVSNHDKESVKLPPLPGSSKYLVHGQPCSDWGLVGWALGPEGGLDRSKFKYFVFVSSTVRGPFMPSYLQPYMHWVEPLISRLNDNVKLAGATLSCHSGLKAQGNASSSGALRRSPRIPLGAVATDSVGLEVMLNDGQVFGCHSTQEANAYFSEAGAPAAVLKAGYNLDTLLAKFQGVDWRDERSWKCNGLVDAAGPDEYAYDGTWLDALEVMFIRVKSNLLLHRLPSAVKAVKLSSWEAGAIADRMRLPPEGRANVTERISGNDYKNNAARFKLPRVLTGLVRGMKCFDLDFFVAKNADVRSQSQYPHVVWRFFVYVGQFEDRAYRYTCPINYDQFVKPAF